LKRDRVDLEVGVNEQLVAERRVEALQLALQRARRHPERGCRAVDRRVVQLGAKLCGEASDQRRPTTRCSDDRSGRSAAEGRRG